MVNKNKQLTAGHFPHTVTPWQWYDNGIDGTEIGTKNQSFIAGGMTENDADFIVEACNNYERLVSENKRLGEALEDFLRVCEHGAYICHDADVIDNARKALERKQP